MKDEDVQFKVFLYNELEKQRLIGSNTQAADYHKHLLYFCHNEVLFDQLGQHNKSKKNNKFKKCVYKQEMYFIESFILDRGSGWLHIARGRVSGRPVLK